MFENGRTQVVVYVVIAAVLALVGFNSLRGSSGTPEAYGPASDVAGAAGGTDAAGAGGTPAGPDPGSGISVSSDRSKLVVDVSGAVRRPGVYEFEQGMRVIDAIRRAGGTLPRAVPGAINRAAELADGQQVVVPVTAGGPAAPGAAAGAVTAGVGVTPGAAADVPISLGTATPEQLEEIDGIGPVTAAAIIEFRDSQGGLGSIEELDQVSGIGPVTMEALRSGLTP